MRKAVIILLGFLPYVASAQSNNGNIKGIIHTSDGQPAPSVTVRLKGSDRMALTAESGDFIFKGIHHGHDTLEVSLVGYQTLLQPVDVSEGQTVKVSLQLVLSNNQLHDVIIAGNGNKWVRRRTDDLAKMPLANLENAQSLSIVNKSLMDEQSAFTVDQAIANVPGITKLWDATGRAGDGGSYFTSRGFSVQSTLRDGVAGNITGTIDGADIERLEVLKGPSGTLFGSTLTSFGGLINMVSKKPYDGFGGEASYSGGTYSYNRLAADFNTPLDSAHKILLRINTSYTSQNSFQDFGFSRRFMIAPELSYKASDKLNFLVQAEIYKGEQTTPEILYFNTTVAALGVNNAKYLNEGYSRSYMSNDLTISNANTNFFGKMNYEFSKSWKSQTSVALTQSSADGYQPYFYLTAGDTALQRMVWKPVGGDNALDIQENINGHFKIGGMQNRFLGGLDYYHYHANIAYQQYMGYTPQTGTMESIFDVVASKGYAPNYQNFNKAKVDSAFANSPAAPYYNDMYSANTYSAYVSDVLNITDNLIASAAVRIDRYDNKGNFDPTTGNTSGGYGQTDVSPKFGLVYQIVPEKVSLFGNYQNGFINENGTDYQGKAFKPEQANQWEGGVKADAFDGKLSGTVSYYDIKVNNMIRSYPSNPLLSIQDGTQVSKGVEAEVYVNPFPGFNFMGGFSYNDSKYTQADADVDGRRPTTAGSPTTANLWTSYRLMKGPAKGLGIGVGGTYASDNKIQNAVSTGVFTLPAYTLVNASIFYDAAKFRIALKVNNLTNQQYWIGYTTVDPQQLRSVMATVAIKW